MKLSVVVPVYNGQVSIVKCLESIANQTYKDMEVIVVNDGSTDNTKTLVEEFCEEHTNRMFRVINQVNMGNSLARKSGIDVAQGEFVGFVDADDWIESEYFESLIKMAIEANADMVCSEITKDIGKKQKIHSHITDKKVLNGTEAIELLHQRKAVYQYMANKVIKKDILEKVIFPKKRMIGEDYTVVVQVLCLSNTIALSKEKGYHYVILEESLSHKGYSESFQNSLQIYPKIEMYLSKQFPNSNIDISNFMLQNYMGAFMAMCKNKNFDQQSIVWIQKYVRSHWNDFICKAPFALHWKIGVTLFAINTNIFKILVCIFR